MTKSALPASQIREAVEARMGAVRDFEPLPEGLVSQVFAFRRGDAAFVVRVGPHRAGYEKDAFVARTCGRPALPIPEVLAVGDVGDDVAFCVSRRAPGLRIHALDDAGAARLAPAVLAALGEIGRADISAVDGWGRFDAAGRAPWRSWRDYLLRFDAGDAWIARLPAHDAAAMRRALSMVERLAPAAAPERRLIHGDFGSANLIADGEAISAIIDWDLAAVGDALYDVAGLLFWGETRLAAVCETLRRRHAAQARTLLCYQLRTGVEEVRAAVTGGVTYDLGWLLGRMRELMGAAEER